MPKPIRPQFVPDVITFLAQHFGLRYGLADPEGDNVLIEIDDIPAWAMQAVLMEYAEAFRVRMERERKNRMQTLMGGPFNNQPYYDRNTLVFLAAGKYTTRHYRHVSRGRWAVYEGDGFDDPRLWFRGYAGSQRKARHGDLLPASPGII